MAVNLLGISVNFTLSSSEVTVSHPLTICQTIVQMAVSAVQN